MATKGHYVPIQEILNANHEQDLDGLSNIDKLVEVFGPSKMQPKKDETYPAFVSPYLKNPLGHLKERNVQKLKKLTKQKTNVNWQYQKIYGIIII